MLCIAISLHISCPNHGITRFPSVKLMIPGGNKQLFGTENLSPCGLKLQFQPHQSAHRPLDWLIDALSRCFVSLTSEYRTALWSMYRFVTGQNSLTYLASCSAVTAARPLDCILFENTQNLSFPSAKLIIPRGPGLILRPKI